MLYSLIYVSTAVRLLDNNELLEILRTSRKNNVENNLTGMLLYKEGNFLQILEGEEPDVKFIFEKIKKDPRHTDIIIIFEGVSEAREFGNWQMAFLNLENESIKNEPAYSQFLRNDFRDESYNNLKPKTLAQIVLANFKDRLS